MNYSLGAITQLERKDNLDLNKIQLLIQTQEILT